MNIQDIISIITLVAGGGGVVYAINIKSRIKAEKASASLATAEADSKIGENWQKYAEKLEKKIEQLEFKLDKVYSKMGGMTKVMAKMANHKDYAEYHICKKIGCPEREPSIGSYKSKIDCDEDNK